MLFVAILLPTLLGAVQATPPASAIVVTGRPWAPFISPMGEPFRARASGEDTLARWFHQADRNHDGALTVDEMRADAERFFAKLDTDHNGAIEPEEIVQYEWEIAPEIQVASRWKKSRPGTPAAQASRGEPDREGRRHRRGELGENDNSERVTVWATVCRARRDTRCSTFRSLWRRPTRTLTGR